MGQAGPDLSNTLPTSSAWSSLFTRLCTGCAALAADMEVCRMSTKLDVDVTELWREFKEHPTTPLRNRS